MAEFYHDDDDVVARRDSASEDRQTAQQEFMKYLEDSEIESEIRPVEGRESMVLAKFRNGRRKREVVFRSGDRMRAAIDADIGQYVFLGDYLAIASYKNNTIEAAVRPAANINSRFVFRRLYGEQFDSGDALKIVIEKNSDELPRIEIGLATDALQACSSRMFRRMRHHSILISGIEISHHDAAVEVLRKITDSLFFQIDMQKDILLALHRDVAPPPPRSRNRKLAESELQFPKVEFDKGPAALYVYARSAIGMPLLQFLAYYQVVEFYYSVFSEEDAKRRISYILKEPAFRIDRDTDIGRILAAASSTMRGVSTELAQLKSTVQACVDPAELRGFIEEDAGRAAFFRTKHKGLSDIKLPLNDKNADLRNAVAEMIYDIRCKIVHTKSESPSGGTKLLLPYSKEAEQMSDIIDVMQHVARRVLVAASAPLSI